MNKSINDLIDIDSFAADVLLLASKKTSNGLKSVKATVQQLKEFLEVSKDGAEEGFKYLNAFNQLEKMRVNNKYYPQYTGLYRYLNHDGGINWYFLFYAIYESQGKFFSSQSVLNCVEKAIRTGVAAPYQVNTQYAQYQKVSIGGKIFQINIAGVSGSTIPNVANVKNTGTSGDFVYDGSLTLEYLGKPFGKTVDLPAQWQWFLVDVQPNLYLIDYPDSNDSYGAMLVACAAKVATKAWLSKNSGIGGLTNYDVLMKVIDNNVVNQLDGGLSKVFQNDITPEGGLYPIRFLQDNCEAYAGVRGAMQLAAIYGDANREEYLKSVLAGMKQGIMNMWDAKNTRFKTYSTEDDWNPNQVDYKRFINKDRFSLAPWRLGILTNEEIKTYGYPVLKKILSYYPNLYKDAEGIDWFGLTDWFAFVSYATNSLAAARACQRRIAVREQGQLTIGDIVGGLVTAPWCGIYQEPPMQPNDRSLIVFEQPPEAHILEVWDRADKVIVYVNSEEELQHLYLRLPSPHDLQEVKFITSNKINNLHVWARENYDGTPVYLATSDFSEVEKSLTFTYIKTSNIWFN